jgi:hypothetical protein
MRDLGQIVRVTFPVLSHRAPKIVSFAPDLHKNLVQVPHVTQLALATLQLSCVLRPELPTPLADGLMGDGDSPLREQVLNVAQAQRGPIVQPDAVTDDLRREPVSMILLRSHFRPGSLARIGSS